MSLGPRLHRIVARIGELFANVTHARWKLGSAGVKGSAAKLGRNVRATRNGARVRKMPQGLESEVELRQAGAIAYRVSGGRLKVLLATTRETKRWIIPRGNIADGLTPSETAAKEAFEEAGVRGELSEAPLGRYAYRKRLKKNRFATAVVDVYLLHATRRARAWPEQDERTVKWLPIDEASRLVEEKALASLLRRLMRVQDEIISAAANMR